MRVRAKSLNDKERIETLDALYTASASLSGRTAMKAFLRDLLTESERIMLGRRILIARKLLDGESVVHIAEDMHTGIDTVYKVSKWLDDSVPGYENAVKGMKKEFGKRKGKVDKGANTFAAMKSRYPGHFLFFS